jgi:hypothetical protein
MDEMNQNRLIGNRRDEHFSYTDPCTARKGRLNAKKRSNTEKSLFEMPFPCVYVKYESTAKR